MGESLKYSVRQIYDMHDSALRSFLGRMLPNEDDVRDIAQNVYVRVARIEDLTRLEPNPRAYIFQIAKNLVRDQYRRQKTRLSESQIQEWDDDLPSNSPSPEEMIDWRQRMDFIKESIHKLDPEVRKAFLLSRIRNLTYPEIAEEMGISSRTVRRHVAEALSLIQVKLEKKK